MESMDDSGFDSDHKAVLLSETIPNVPQKAESPNTKSVSQASDLQKRIKKQREKNRRNVINDEQPKHLFSLLGSRLKMPNSRLGAVSSVLQNQHEQQLLVAVLTDDSEDEFDVPRISKEAHREMTEQLIKDGYNLDIEPDDDDLDLIPPRPLHERCGCCPSVAWQALQCAIL